MSDIWAEKHRRKYATSGWIDKPSIFAETAIHFFPARGRVLELGAGQGQDSRFFAEKDYAVVSTDLESSALEISKSKLPPKLEGLVALQQLDMRDVLPFADESFEVVYAHLALHYFTAEITERLFGEIRRVLQPGGVFAFLVNSTHDPEYGVGEQIEPDYFYTAGIPKRYFTVGSGANLTKGFKVKILDDEGESYKDIAKGVHNLIRFIGIKPE